MRHWRNDVDFNPNVNIQYSISNVLGNKYYYYNGSSFTEITNGSVKRIWDILNEQPNTTPLNSFWPNALVLIRKDDHPWLIWSKYPGTNSNYKVFRKHGGLDGDTTKTFNVDSLSYLDTSVYYATMNQTSAMRYTIYADQTPTNTVEMRVNGYDPGKIATSKITRYEYSLSHNYPNPFNPSTIITFTNKYQEYVELRVYDMLGREIRTLTDQEMEPGEHKVTFDAGNLPSGIYFYNIKAGDLTQTCKMILMK